MNAWAAFLTGWGRVFRYWQVIIFLYAINLCSGILLALLPAVQLIQPARLLSVQEAAQGIPVWMMQELAGLLSNGTGMPIDAAQAIPLQELPAAMAFGMGAAVFAPLLAWLTGSILVGGMILVYSEAPRPFNWKRFFWGCWHWWFVFLALGLVQVFFILALVLGGIWLVVAIGQTFPGALWIVLLPLLGFMILILLSISVLEYTRVVAVQEGTRNLPRSAIRSARFLFQRPVGFIGFYSLAAVLLLAIHLLFRAGLFPQTPLQFWPVVLLVQQAFVLVRLFARGQRLAGAAALSGLQADIISDDLVPGRI